MKFPEYRYKINLLLTGRRTLSQRKEWVNRNISEVNRYKLWICSILCTSKKSHQSQYKANDKCNSFLRVSIGLRLKLSYW